MNAHCVACAIADATYTCQNGGAAWPRRSEINDVPDSAAKARLKPPRNGRLATRAPTDVSVLADRGTRIRTARRARSEKNTKPMLNQATFAMSVRTK